MTPHEDRTIAGLVFAALFLSACGASTGTQVTQNGKEELSKVKKLAILIQNDNKFGVRLSQDKNTDGGAVLFGLIGAGIESAVRTSADQRRADQLSPKVANYIPEKILIQKLQERFIAAKIYAAVDPVTAADLSGPRAKDYDAVLTIVVKNWGLYFCQGSAVKDALQAGLTAEAKVTPIGRSNAIWERNDYYMDSDCKDLDTYKNQDGLLVANLDRAVDRYAARAVNEIEFP